MRTEQINADDLEHNPVTHIEWMVKNGARYIAMNQTLYDIYTDALKVAGKLDASGNYADPAIGSAKISLDKTTSESLVRWSDGPFPPNMGAVNE